MESARKQLQQISAPLKAIEKYINASFYAITNEPNSCLGIKTIFEIATSDVEIQIIIKADNKFTYQLLIGLVKQAIDKQEINITQDAEMLTDYIINHFTGWHESFIIHQDKTRIKKTAKFLIEQLKK